MTRQERESELARQAALYARISVKRRRVVQPSTPATLVDIPVPVPGNPPDAKTLIGLAHTVLVRYVPREVLPQELAKVRALLDRHMFGRDGRGIRDDVVKIAHQIDHLRLAKIR